MFNTKRRKIIQIIPCDHVIQATYNKQGSSCQHDYTYRRVACLALVEDPDKIQSVVPMVYYGAQIEFADELEGFCSVSR